MKRSLLFIGAVLGGGALVWKLSQSPRPVPLQQKVVIITGASSGIGRATAHAFAARGARVVLVARRAHMLAEVQSELAEYGTPTWIMPADITREEDLETLIERVTQKFGRIDVLINNAGLARGGPLQSLDAANLRYMIEVNLYGAMRLTQLVLPIMLDQKDGHIVNVSSATALLAPPGIVAYSATRAAILGFSEALRREVDGTGIRVSTILPGWTRTALLEEMDKNDLEVAGMLSTGLTLDDPQVPARAIVEAVQYNRRQVTLGGPKAQLGTAVALVIPQLIDLYYRLTFDKVRALGVMRKLGT